MAKSYSKEMGTLVVQKADKASKRSGAAVKPKAERVNPIQRLMKFLHEVRVELTKVSWPNRQQVITSTIVVMIVVTFFALLIGGIDLVFVKSIQALSEVLKKG
ncbi:MAG: preprotein translocase subunit SecE [Candidatus Aquicultorales bacterium]